MLGLSKQNMQDDDSLIIGMAPLIDEPKNDIANLESEMKLPFNNVLEADFQSQDLFQIDNSGLLPDLPDLNGHGLPRHRSMTFHLPASNLPDLFLA